uniref:NADPH oxidase 4 n=1 Tax=Myxine glutinosa TaxID=7769 RepID=UPI00358E6654
MKMLRRFVRWLSSDSATYAFMLSWLGANAWAVWSMFRLYCYGEQYYYLHRMLGLGLCVSRASAAALNLNCSLILLPILRGVLSTLRGAVRVTSKSTRRLLDRSKAFHIACGSAIMIFTGIHCAAHMVNAWNFSIRYDEEHPTINLARYRYEDPRKLLLTTVPGITGILMVVVLFLIATSSSRHIRLVSYNVFWYTHNLYIVFYVLLLSHASGGALKIQTNVKDHIPGCIPPSGHANVSIHWAGVPRPYHESHRADPPSVCRAEPRFRTQLPESWMWVLLPLCIYCGERLMRCVRGGKTANVTSVRNLPGGVIEVALQRPGFSARAGQYVFLQCPEISTFESHPFTLTQCPVDEKGCFMVHLRVLGDWTASLQNLLISGVGSSGEVLPFFQQNNFPRLYVDGPFGGPTEEIFNYEIGLCIAGGIGVTPFVAVLRTLMYDWKPFCLSRLYLVWMCRDISHFTWFADLLASFNDKLWRDNRPDYLTIRLFLTGGGKSEMIGANQTMLNARLKLGRPDWPTIFHDVAMCNRRKTVGVFCCAPKGVSRTLRRLCNAPNKFGTHFELNKESFG